MAKRLAEVAAVGAGGKAQRRIAVPAGVGGETARLACSLVSAPIWIDAGITQHQAQAGPCAREFGEALDHVADPGGLRVGAADCREQCMQLVQPVPLSPSQYRLLAALVRRPGWVFSRGQLLDALGDGTEPGLERTVDSHVKDLRLRLRAIDPTRDPIVTHRGAGYSLTEDW